MDEPEDNGLGESPEAANEGAAAAAKALFTSMKAKMKGSKTGPGGDAAERKFFMMMYQSSCSRETFAVCDLRVERLICTAHGMHRAHNVYVLLFFLHLILSILSLLLLHLILN